MACHHTTNKDKMAWETSHTRWATPPCLATEDHFSGFRKASAAGCCGVSITKGKEKGPHPVTGNNQDTRTPRTGTPIGSKPVAPYGCHPKKRPQGGGREVQPSYGAHGCRYPCGAMRRRMACSRRSASRRLRPSDRAYQRSSQCRAYSSCATRRQSKSRRLCRAGARSATQGSASRAASGASAASAASRTQLAGHLCGGNGTGRFHDLETCQSLQRPTSTALPLQVPQNHNCM